MKIQLPSKEGTTRIITAVLILSGVFVTGMCSRINDACHGVISDLLDRIMEWLMDQDLKRRLP